ncbi:TonB-dependent siderophore receptor [Marinomonas epiphytica]
MKTAFPFKLSLLAAAVASSSYTYAADVLDTIEVAGQTYRNTATKTQLDPEETPQAISIISKEELDEKGIESVAEALRYAAGVNTQLRGGAVTRFDLFNVRGFDNDTILLDGLPLIFNEWNLQPQIDISAIEQIEIFKGPTSTLYGEMPPGGMVNIITKAPQTEGKTAVELTLGSDNKKEVSLDTTGTISDKVNYRVITKASQSDGQATTSENERILFAPSVDINLSKNTLLNLNMYYQKDPSAGIYSALPSKGTVYNNANGQLEPDTYLGDVNWDTYEREFLLLGYKLDHQINGNWSFLQNTRFTTATAYQENVYAYSLGSDDETVNRSAYMTDESVNAMNIDNQLSAFYDIGNAEHNILIGIDYLRSTEKNIYKYGSIGTVNLFSPDTNQVDRGTLLSSLTDDSNFTTEREQLGLYLQDQIRYKDWVLLAGMRYDQYEIDQEGVSASYGINDLNQSSLTGRVGALYKFDNGVSPFINFAQSFEPEAGQDTNGNAFDVSTANQIEAGLKYENSSFRSSATAFHIVKSNVVMRDPSATAYDKIQVGEVTSQGLELELEKSISDELNLSLSYTYQDVEISKDATNGIQGNTPIWTPEKQVSTWLSYQPSKGELAGASFGAGVRYVGEMQVDAANSGTVPSYTLVDVSAGYDLAQLSSDWQGASVQFSVSNLFDKTYYTCYDTSNCWFGAERSFELKGRYEF